MQRKLRKSVVTEWRGLVQTRFMGELDSRRAAFVSWMRANKLNVSKVAKRAGVPATTLYDFVRGDTQSLKADTEDKIALAFNCDSGVIFKGERYGGAEGRCRQAAYVPCINETRY